MKKYFLLLTITLMVCILAGCGPAFKKDIVRTWQVQVEFEDGSTEKFQSWLNDAILSENVDVHDYMPADVVTMDLIIMSDGTWSQNINRASYEAYCNNVLAGCKNAFLELLVLRGCNAEVIDGGKSYEEQLSDAETLFNEKTGITFEQYILREIPKLYEDYDVFNSYYSAYGTYKIDKDYLTRTVTSGSIPEGTYKEDYMMENEVMVISECVTEANTGLDYPVTFRALATEESEGQQ